MLMTLMNVLLNSFGSVQERERERKIEWSFELKSTRLDFVNDVWHFMFTRWIIELDKVSLWLVCSNTSCTVFLLFVFHEKSGTSCLKYSRRYIAPFENLLSDLWRQQKRELPSGYFINPTTIQAVLTNTVRLCMRLCICLDVQSVFAWSALL